MKMYSYSSFLNVFVFCPRKINLFGFLEKSSWAKKMLLCLRDWGHWTTVVRHLSCEPTSGQISLNKKSYLYIFFQSKCKDETPVWIRPTFAKIFKDISKWVHTISAYTVMYFSITMPPSVIFFGSSRPGPFGTMPSICGGINLKIFCK